MEDSISVVSGMITGSGFKTVRLGDRFHTIKNPWTLTLARALGKLSGIKTPLNASQLDEMAMIPDEAPKVAAFIAVMAVGNVKHWGLLEWLRYRKAYKDALCTTEAEKRQVFIDCLSLVNGSDFFDYASLGVMLADQMAKAKQQ